MHIRVGDTVTTRFCTGRVDAIIEGRERGWEDTLYLEITVLCPRVYHKRRRNIIKATEVQERRK